MCVILYYSSLINQLFTSNYILHKVYSFLKTVISHTELRLSKIKIDLTCYEYMHDVTLYCIQRSAMQHQRYCHQQ